MAPRASKSRWLLRDLPRSYVVLGIAVVVSAGVAYSIDWSSPPPPVPSATELAAAKADYERHYRGAIIIPTDETGICLKITLDNHTGYLTGGSYGKCEPDKPRQVAKEPAEQARLRALGSAFRRSN